MSTTPTLRDAERVVGLLWHALVDLVESTRGTMPKHLFIQCSEATGEAKKLRAALTQGAGEAVEPVAWPRDAAEVRQFMNSNCEAVEFAVDEATPDDGDRYHLTAHDFLSAVNWWADFPHHPSEEAAQQLQQAVARALEELKFHPQASHVEPNYRDWFNKTIDAAIRAKGTHD